MAKNKPVRTMQKIGEAQRATEETNRNKFDETQGIAQGKPERIENTTLPSNGRVSPQISCTVLPEDKQMLNDITVFAINKYGKPLNTSAIIRAIIRLGYSRKEELEF